MQAKPPPEKPTAQATELFRGRHQLDLRKSIKITTWNVITLAKDGYHEAMARELARLCIDVACLTEARLVNSGKDNVEGTRFSTRAARSTILVFA